MIKKFRPPAVPLMLSDPFFSIWSFSDRLYDDATRHWTDARQNIVGLVVVDNKDVFRFMGKVHADSFRSNEPHKPIEQTNLEITPLRTHYTFENEILRLDVTFTSPLLLDDLYLVSRPVSYIDYSVTSLDENEHSFKVIFGVYSEIGGNGRDTLVEIVKESEHFIKVGAGNEGVLGFAADICTADWGYFCLFSKNGQVFVSTSDVLAVKAGFGENDRGYYYKSDAPNGRYDCCKPYVICTEQDFSLKKDESATDFVCLAYDDIKSIEYLGRTALAYYKKDGETFMQACAKSLEDHDSVMKRVVKRDEEILASARQISNQYADVISLAYRQAIAAHKLTFCDGELQLFSKECGSNGCIGTVDVTYPSMPIFLLYNPELVFAMMNPVFAFDKTDMWLYDYAPHDLGTYPLANGQFYGRMHIHKNQFGRERHKKYGKNPLNRGEYYHEGQMPVEECGNMIICVAAACRATGDFSYAKKHFSVLKKWAEFLVTFGLDPENQLCTDDFSGHLAHNCNLSVKAIIGLACFALICDELGENSGRYHELADEYAAMWKGMAFDKDHYKLVYDKPGSWSMKYNMVWDSIMGLDVFDKSILKTESEYYKSKIQKYGLPLDSRGTLSKTDWAFWTAAMCADEELENMIVSGVWNMLCDTPDRYPFTDLYDTVTSERTGTYANRTVQGGLFVNMLARTNILK